MPLMLGPRGDIGAPLKRLQGVRHTYVFFIKVVDSLPLNQLYEILSNPEAGVDCKATHLGTKEEKY